MDTEYHYLPRLERSNYQGRAIVLWTLVMEDRARGWLDAKFHAGFRELMLHAASREGLFCPTYSLMPDHLHLVWMGLERASDQILAMRFLRRHLQNALDRSGEKTGFKIRLQKQSHDHVLREKHRERGGFAGVCNYVLCNPHRAALVKDPSLWPYSGAVVPGFPEFSPFQANFWPIFWRAYEKAGEPFPDCGVASPNPNPNPQTRSGAL